MFFKRRLKRKRPAGYNPSPDDAKWFDSYDKAAEQARDIVKLNFAGVTQIRLISEAFDNS